jgi:hypothetical protein
MIRLISLMCGLNDAQFFLPDPGFLFSGGFVFPLHESSDQPELWAETMPNSSPRIQASFVQADLCFHCTNCLISLMCGLQRCTILLAGSRLYLFVNPKL